MPKRRMIMLAVGSLAVITVASTSALITLVLAGSGPDMRSVAAATSKPLPSVSTVVPTRPEPPPSTAQARTVVVPTPSPSKVRSPEPRTAVQITRWGSPTTKPQATVNLDQLGCTASNLLWRQDALRCFTTTDSGQSGVADPCFDLNTGGLMCPSAPWSTGWIEISAQGNSGNTDPPTTQGSPWGIEIASGVRCIQTSGATPIISGLHGSYYCPGDTWLYGDPSRGSTWHIKLSSTPNGPLRTVALRKVWF